MSLIGKTIAMFYCSQTKSVVGPAGILCNLLCDHFFLII